LQKRFKYRIYPTKSQETQIQKNFGCCRFVYNHFLTKQIERHEAGGGYTGIFDTTKELPQLKRTEGFKWLKEADSASLSYALCDLDYAFKRFFRNIKQKDTAPGFPCFKSKKRSFQSYRCKNRQGRQPEHHQSIEVLEGGNGNGKGKYVKLPKLGLVKCRVSRKPEGRILSASVIQSPSGKYYVSLYCTDINPVPLPKTGKSIGLHLGLVNLTTASDGKQFENPRYLERSRKKISRLQRELSRKTSDGKNREKARIKLARAYERVTNQKTDTLHKLTTQLVRDHDIICVRNEPVRMENNKLYAKYLADANWGEMSRLLSYKCNWYGKTLVKVDKLLPSAKVCSSCGHKNEQLKQYQQAWVCPKCKARHNRGVNSAVNILNSGLRTLTVN